MRSASISSGSVAERIGNSGPLPIFPAPSTKATVSVAVLSGNRNFEGRVNPMYAQTICRRRRLLSPMRWPDRFWSI